MSKFLSTLVISTLSTIVAAWASAQVQNSPLEQYAPTPKAMEETRYGSLPVDLNSGTLSFEIPIGSYSDQDFTIPISLRYSSGGLQPSRPSGEAGLGWSLSAGGSISREIIGLDDFKTGGYYYANHSYASASIYAMSYSVVTLDSTYPSLDGTHETTSDIYHFTFPGHSGSFLIANDGTFQAYGTSGERGTYDISYDPSSQAFTIRTSDGMAWRFGSSAINREILLRQNGILETSAHALTSDEMSPVTWLLDRITAPNGRMAEFTYISTRTNNNSIPTEGNDVITTFGRGRNANDTKTRYKFASLVYTSYLDHISIKEISGSAKNVASFSWTRKSYKEIDGTENADYTKMIVCTRRLTSVSLSEGSTTLRTASLSYDDSRRRPLLTSVSIPVYGSWTMEYNLPSGSANLPGQLTNGVDFWGFYNGNTSNPDNLIAPTTVSALTYNEALNTYLMDPAWSASVLGTVKKITWPTGGSSSITYEANSAARIVLRRQIPSVTPIPEPDGRAANSFTTSLEPVLTILHNSECGGVRVKSILDDSLTDGTFSRSFSYVDGDNASSGIVQEFNRYYAGKVGGIDTMNPNLKYPDNGLTQRHVAYSDVRQTFSDGSSERTTFSSWEDQPDTFSPNWAIYICTNLGYGDNYDLFIDNILREGNSLAYRRGQPLRHVICNADGSVAREKVFSYTDEGAAYATYIVGSGHYWWSARRNLADRVLQSVSTTDHPAPGVALTSTEAYSHDTYGRRTAIIKTDSDGTVRKTQYTYHSGTVRPSLITKAASSVIPAGTTTSYNTEATAYTYTQSGNLWNLTSEIRTLYNASGSGTVADQTACSSYDATGHPRQMTVNGRNHALVWGYSGRYPVAIVGNCTLSGLPTALQSTLTAGLSDTQKKALYELTGKEVHVYTYSPSVGVTQEIDPSGRSRSYTYDSYGRLSAEKDAGGTSLQSYTYGARAYSSTSSLRYVETVTNTGSVSRSEQRIHDGLGREWMHLVGKSGTLNTTEMAVMTKRDGLDRPTRSYLPFAASSVTLASAYSAQSSYWSGQHAGEGPYAFSRHAYSGGTLAFPTSEMAPGKAIFDASKQTLTVRSANSANEVPRIRYNPANGSVTVSGYYPAGTLLRTQTTSPDGIVSVDFRTTEGIPVLNRTLSGSVQQDTYTVYDLWDRPAWILTPLMGNQVRSAAAGTSVTFLKTGTEAAAGCFIYEYDARGNTSTIRRPGAGYDTLVYNTIHQLTSTTPSTLRDAQLLYVSYTYDALGRKTASTLNRSTLIPISSVGGEDPAGKAAEDPQRVIDETLHALSSYTYGQSTSVDCITTDTPGTPYASIPSELAFAARSGIVSAADLHVTGELILETQYPLITPVLPFDASASAIGWQAGDGMVGDFPARTAYYYDAMGNIAQLVTKWPDGSLTRVSRSYDLEGNVLKDLEEHRPVGSAASDTDWILTQNSYDSRGNLLSAGYWIGRGASPSSSSASLALSASFTYDGVGRLTARTLSSSGHTLTTSYTSTLQGWTASATASIDGVQTFREDLKYWDPDRTSIAKRYGGDISEATSLHAGYTSRSEGYAYDAAGRLSGTVSFSGSATTPGTANVEDGITYDPAGNITALKRKGVSGGMAANLTMNYTGSRLTSVSDAAAGTSWTNLFHGDGSLKKDGRTGKYYAPNLLGNVAQVAVQDAMSVSGYSQAAAYSYLPDGTKYLTQMAGGASVLYRGAFTYRRVSGVLSLESVALPGGRVFVSGSTRTPYGFVTDHRDNVRAVVNLTSGTVVERSDYYAYGTRISQPYSGASAYPQLSANRWRFSGKEEQDAVASSPTLDFGARQYDPFIARWLSPDPLAEKYYAHSPYLFCAGSPVNFVDPRGETIVVRHINEDNSFIEYEWQERNDVWGFYDAEGNLFDHDDNYIQSVSSALSYLMQGHNGSGLIKTLVDMDGRLLITAHKSNDNFYHQASKSVSWIPNISKLGEPSITLGHELAHALDHFSGTINNDIWIPMGTYGLNKAVLLNEIYSTHIENLIRKEHGIPLRNAYLSDETGGRFIGPPIIDSRGRSLYFDAYGHTSYSIVKPRNRYKY